jgi:hypothetical protein
MKTVTVMRTSFTRNDSVRSARNDEFDIVDTTPLPDIYASAIIEL